jgi:S1-C subfamily serine protease
VGIGFAIPASMARHVMDQLIKFGEVRRGTLGIFVQDLTPQLAGAFDIDAGKGVLVAEIVNGSAAQKAGLRPGDVIVSMDKKPIGHAQDFHNMEGRVALGESMHIEYLRDGKTRKTDLVVQSLPVLIGGELDWRLEGARFSELSAQQRQQDISGVVLDQLEPRSRLAREGLAEGDIIVAVNRQRVRNLDDLGGILEQNRGSILLQINRGGRAYVARID